MSDLAMGPTGAADRRSPVLRPHACFACGELNVHGMHLQLHVGDGRCTTDLTLEERFQGWDGIAHGGIITTILDEVMAWALLDLDSWGLTARLTVDFRLPVPVGRPLHAEGWIVERRRRLTRTQSRLVDATSGAILAEADAAYIDAPAADRERLRRLYEAPATPTAPAEPAAPAQPAGRS